MQQALSRVPAGAVPLSVLSAVDIGTMLSECVIPNFRRTVSVLQANQGWGLGCLVAFANNEPQLLELDQTHFHPELKGFPDPNRGDRIWRAASMGAGQMLADSFLAHAYRLLFGARVPRIDRAKLAVSWALDHVASGTGRSALRVTGFDAAWRVLPKGPALACRKPNQAARHG